MLIGIAVYDLYKNWRMIQLFLLQQKSAAESSAFLSLNFVWIYQ